MIRFFFRVCAVVALAVAVMYAIIDATRSIGAGKLVITPLQETWVLISRDSLELSREWLAETVHPFLNDVVLANLLQWPTWLLCAVFAVLFYFAGRKRVRKSNRFRVS